MSTPDKLEMLFAAARRELAPQVDVVDRVLARLPGQPTVIIPDLEAADWIGAGVSTLVAACCLWLAMPLWSASWPESLSVWHPLAAMLYQ
ncbi:MAG: hypothetical protein JWN70_845 [Planctomycetaceae bacterium]|nr:hypothetical protein [Planctomycetaceae bacterium]